ncbi:MAG: hypothetical protein RR595_12525 [Lysinibacillus sp.]
MTKLSNLLSLVTGNVLTLGAIYIYATQSHVKISTGTYVIVMMMFILLYGLCFYVWLEPKESSTKQYSK